MSPSHTATLAALASVVAALGESKSKDCKAILKDLKKNHGDALGDSQVDPDAIETSLNASELLACMHAMEITWAYVMDGAEPCIVDGRYAVRTADGLKLGPKV